MPPTHQPQNQYGQLQTPDPHPGDAPPLDAAPPRRGWLRPLGRAWQSGSGALGRGWGRMWAALANVRRRLWRRQIPDYVVILLDHAVSERAPEVPWYYAYLPWVRLPMSLEYLHIALERIAGDPDVQGVVFLLKSPGLSLAKAQSLNQLLLRFRDWDADRRGDSTLPPKRIVAHLEDGGAAALVVAAAADKILFTPLSLWSFAGLRIAPLYIKETLARIGVKMDVAQIAPWKTAMDRWQHSHMTPEARDQHNWLLDSLYEDIVAAIAQGRKLDPAQVRAYIDHAPLTATAALQAGLVDALLYEDELPHWLAETFGPSRHHKAKTNAKATTDAHAVQPADLSADRPPDRPPDRPADRPAVRLRRYAQAQGLLYRHYRERHVQAVGVLTLEGAIAPGESRRFPIPLPLVGDKFMGSRTAAYQIRAARRNPRLGAVVVHVDSGGGSALASDLIWRELQLLGQEKPLVIYMGDMAASGGYYIATSGRKIVAQSATLTGSIGVIIAKAVTGEATDKLGANREVIQRGAHAGLFAEDSIWSPTERAKILEYVHSVYTTFKERVSAGRGLPLESLDNVANGRVWTGRQALGNGLVDALGDIWTAIELACAEAGMPQDGSVPVINISTVRTRLLAQPAHSPAAFLSGGSQASEWTPILRALLAGEWETLVGREQVWLWADGLPRLRD